MVRILAVHWSASSGRPAALSRSAWSGRTVFGSTMVIGSPPLWLLKGIRIAAENTMTINTMTVRFPYDIWMNPQWT